MEWLNYHHLFYFFTAVREGGISRAAKVLRLAQPTVSAQLKTLETSLGEPLFTRSGRKLILTDVGQVVYRYATEIFSLGRELQDTVRGRPTGKPLRLTVGVADVLPKLIAYRLLEPALKLDVPVHLVCAEDRPERLIAELVSHSYDVVLTDAPVPASSPVRAFSHLLGESAVALFAAPRLAASLRKDFPASLTGAPMLLPAEHTSLRRTLTEWFDARGLRPRVLGEFQDTALLTAFGQAGIGVFPAPMVIAQEVKKQSGAELLGVVPGVRERFYAVTVERRLKHPAVVALSEKARGELFAPEPRAR